ncbi:MAG: cation diffusion facilitator family transporter [Chloroflexota bacterium]|nr:cation diffusion facilitator family transporter [Chloroflexota bacterium]
MATPPPDSPMSPQARQPVSAARPLPGHHAHDDAHEHSDHAHADPEHAATHAHEDLGQGAHTHGDHDPADEHEHGDHDHAHNEGVLAGVLGIFGIGHGHSHGTVQVDSALEGSTSGIRALRTSLVILGATAVFQLVIVWISSSAGLLADTIHNFADALTALPLWVAFTLSRRSATRRFTYGYDRAEDVAGVFIVLIIFLSAAVAVWTSVEKLLHPAPMANIGWVVVAAIAGFIGNEWVAQVRIRTGQRIGSAALVADGQHARADGITSLAVLIGAFGALQGIAWLDPLVGLLITFAILVIGKQAGQAILYRLMDAVDPALVDQVEQTARRVAGVQGIHDVRVRWHGHQLIAELHSDVDPALSTVDSHAIAEAIRHALLHGIAGLGEALVHIDPAGHAPEHYHETTWHHRPA